MDVALFGGLGRNFDAEQVFKQSQKVPIVAVFAGMLVERYSGLISQLFVQQHYIAPFLFPCVADIISLSCYLGKGFTVRSTTASKYYLDLDIPEVQEFRARCSPTEFNDLYLRRNTLAQC